MALRIKSTLCWADVTHCHARAQLFRQTLGRLTHRCGKPTVCFGGRTPRVSPYIRGLRGLLLRAFRHRVCKENGFALARRPGRPSNHIGYYRDILRVEQPIQL